jgi:non-heme Fe2+,alpha-ketoglutarate-dependent halogenase
MHCPCHRRQRCGLTVRYCPPEVTPVNPGWGHNAILCRGANPSGRWMFPPQPLGEDLSTGQKPQAIGSN